MTGAVVRPATVDDAEAIAAVHVEGWQVGYAGVVPQAILDALSVAAKAAQWRGWLSDAANPTRTLVSERDGRVCAFVSFAPAREEGAGIGEIAAIYALPSAWGAGDGPALLDAALAALRAAGFGEVMLWVLRDNPRARRFYEKHGLSWDGGEKTPERVPVPHVRYRARLA